MQRIPAARLKVEDGDAAAGGAAVGPCCRISGEGGGRREGAGSEGAGRSEGCAADAIFAKIQIADRVPPAIIFILFI